MAHTSSLRLLTLHALRLKGTAEAEVVAELIGRDVDDVRAELATLQAGDLVAYRHGRMPGFLPTPEGRSLGARLLAEELEATGSRGEIESAYEAFRPHNDELLRVCTAWQLRPVDGTQAVNDHADADYDAGVIARLASVHERVDPVIERLAATLARFSGHRQRLRTALDRVLAGDHDYFTKPMFPSYHSHWFELHEDLLATLGTERATEGNR